jgi:alkylation response protein AidB-like acyl-CoA dehydrogenase
VDFELTDDQVELRDAVRSVVDKECPATLVRAVAEGQGEDAVDALWSTYVQLDWPSLTVPEDDGGMGLTPVELAITLEELGRAADPTPFLATTSQYVALVREVADGDLRRDLLSAVCAGGTGAVADGAEGSLGRGAVTGRADGDGWRLDGAVAHVMDGERAAEVAVVASVDDEPAVFVVPATDLAATRSPSFDATLHVAVVTLDGVLVPAERAVVGAGVADGLGRARQEALTGVAASTVGACQRILDLVLGHVRDRHQFGVPIGSFQAVKHMAVDMYVAIERARALCHFAALTLAEDDDRRHVAASMAKAAAGDAQRIVVAHGIQLFGGLGFTWENDLQLFVRRAKAGELLLGSTHHHRRVVATAALAAHQEVAP